MYQELLKWVIAIVSQPGKTLGELSKKEEKGDEFLTRFVYPLIGLITLAAFAGVLFKQKEFSVELALKSSIKALISSFGGFFLAAYFLNEFWQSMFGREKDIKLCQRFVGYSSALMYSLTIVLLLLPVSDFFFLRVFILYTVYIVWEGAVPYMEVPEAMRLKFTIIASVLIVALPEVIGFLLFMLMPGLRV
ncbi:MAG: hypothetical protein LBF62_04045 [Tannerellaceae bacterium]|jgi:hypothetical protein|nr:hypothetical protein [Tannerellaceae bacterium]